MIGTLVKRYWRQLLVVALIGVLAFLVNHYRDNAITVTSHRLHRMQRTNWLKRAKRALSTSGRRLKAIRALTSLFLLPLLTACGNTQTVYVPAPVVPISADLTADTPIPGMAIPFTWQASLELNAQLYTALGQCNLDKAAIRKIESSRASQ